MLGFMGLCFLIMLFAGMPIGFALGATALFIFLKMDMPILFNMVPQRFFAGLDMFTLMAMPFFIGAFTRWFSSCKYCCQYIFCRNDRGSRIRYSCNRDHVNTSDGGGWI